MSFILSLMFMFLPSYAAADGATIRDVRVEVRLNPQAQELEGRADIRMKVGSSDDPEFFLSPQARIVRVTVNGKPGEFSAHRGAVTVSLPSGEGEQRIEIAYQCRFADALPSSFVSHENPSFGVRSVISSAGTFLDKGAGWYPHPINGAEQLLLRVSAPPGVEAVTEGERTMHRADASGTVSEWLIRSPGAQAALSAGAYRITERRHGNLFLYAYFTTINIDLAERYLDLSAQYIDFYERLLGPYPFPKFAVVENFLPTGYGFPSYTLLGNGILRMPSTMSTTLAHEIAHCWWGNTVMIDYPKGNWGEGLVTYLAEHLLAERRSPAEAKSYRYKLISDYSALVPADKEFPLRKFTSRNDPVSRSIGYGKGAMVFHMIRKEVGDEAFFDTLRLLAREKRGTKIVWDELIGAFEKTSGVPLTSRGKFWLDKTGGVKLGAEELNLKKNGEEWELSGVITADRPEYQASVKLAVVTKRSEDIHAIAVRETRNEFSFRSKEMPVSLRLDPDYDLFRVLGVGDLPATVNRIKGAEELTVITAEGWNYDEHLKLLLESLGKTEVTYLSEVDIKKRLPSGDILIYGYPTAESIVEGLPKGVMVGAKEFEIEGKRFAKPEDLLFVVFPHPYDRSKVVAICLPLSGYAAKRGMPKITHYGSAGYLVFSSGINKLMGALPVSKGGLSYRLTK